jgi:hypothetical protein
MAPAVHGGQALTRNHPGPACVRNYYVEGAKMTLARLTRTSAAALCLLLPALAQEKRAEPAVDISKATPKAVTPKATPLSTGNYENFKNITIAAGQSTTLDSAIDYSNSDRVAVTYRAPTNVDLSGLTAQAYWSNPGADAFSVAEVDSGTNFNYLNVGGSVFQVFGPQFRLVLSNGGKTSITISQVTVFTRSL